MERLERHTQSASPTNCNHCGKTYCHESRLRQHLATSHFGGGIPPRPASLNEPIVGHTAYQDLAEYQEVLDEHRDVIRSDEINRTLWKRINRQIDPDFTYADLKSLLNEVMSEEVSVFKINLGFGVVLYNTIQQTYRYFYVSNNDFSIVLDVNNFFM